MSLERTVWRITRPGSLSRLAIARETLPDPGPGQARLRVEAVGLNFADALACLGLYSATPRGAFVPGLECAGIVEALGPPPRGDAASYPNVAVGDRLAVLTRFGAYADRLNFDIRYATPVPDGWSPAEAAAWPVQGMTAWYGLIERARVAPGEVVLVQSAAGGVGLQALDMLAGVGARVVAAVGGEAKLAFLAARHGLDSAAVIVRHRRRFETQLDEALAAVGSDGFDIVFDAVLGPYFRPAFDRLRPEGRFVLYGAADFMPAGRRRAWLPLLWRWLQRPRLDPLAMITANRCLIAFNLIWLWGEAGRLPAAIAGLRRHTSRAPHVGARLPFAEAPAALRLLQSGSTVGKVVLEL